MSMTTTAKFAIEIREDQPMRTYANDTDVIASKKEEVTLKDGSKKTMVIFFARDKRTVLNLQEKGLARTNKQTIEDFKKICMAGEKKMSPTQFAVMMRKIQALQEGRLNTSFHFTDKIRIDYSPEISIPLSFAREKFVDANRKRENEQCDLIRVDSELNEKDLKIIDFSRMNLREEEVEKRRRGEEERLPEGNPLGSQASPQAKEQKPPIAENHLEKNEVEIKPTGLSISHQRQTNPRINEGVSINQLAAPQNKSQPQPKSSPATPQLYPLPEGSAASKQNIKLPDLPNLPTSPTPPNRPALPSRTNRPPLTN